MFSTYDQWKLRSPDDEAAYQLGYDPIAAAEAEDEWLWLDSLENPQPVDCDDDLFTFDGRLIEYEEAA